MPINDVRNTVLAIANKNNYGYISPQDFNLYAQQSQMDLFEDYFYQYNAQLTKENQRMSGTGYADITKGLLEVIDTFYVNGPLLNNPGIIGASSIAPNLYVLPSDYYLINKMLVYTKELADGTTTSVNGGSTAVNDSTADFISRGVVAGDIVSTITGGVVYNTVVSQVVNATSLLVATTPGVQVWNAFPKTYNIYSANNILEAERVAQSKITMLNNSVLTKPNLTYPAFTQNGDFAQIYPNTVDGIGQLVSQYIRFPFVPKWTYVDLTNGEPAFDEGAVDYQDFELPNDDEVNLIMKILQYAGMSIREIQAVQFAGAEEQQSEQSEK